MSTPAGPAVGQVIGHAYPWDVLGDPDFTDRCLHAGIGEVALAAAYHSVRAATPLHPDHQLIEATHAALYRPLRAEVWDGHRLRPRAPDWMTEPDAFGAAAARLGAAGIAVDAWIVLNHNSALGRAHPDVAVVNCFGDQYPYALCPQQPEVRAYTATLVAEAVRDVPLAGVTLEAWGQLGVVHNSLHEKTDGAWTSTIARLLSICCCSRCRQRWRDRGVDDTQLVSGLVQAVRTFQKGGVGTGGPAPVAEVIGAEEAEAVLATRIEGCAASLSGALDALGTTSQDRRVSVFAGADDWSNAPLRCLTSDNLARIDAVIQGAWSTSPQTLGALRTLRDRLPDRVTVSAYLTALPPATRDELLRHARDIRSAGADTLHLYHLGLAGTERLSWLAEVVSEQDAGLATELATELPPS